MGKVLGIVNRKGGVGKTTTATTMSYLLSKEGCKVALIDFDGQRHTTKLCGVTAPEQLSVTIYDILKCIVMNEELPDKGSYMIRTETGVDLIPANNKLDNFDKLMCDTDFAEYKLKEFVDTIKEQYDYILIDGMPKMGTAMENILTAIARIYQKYMENNENLLPFEVKDYESVKNRLYVVALNRNNNQDYLRDAVRRDISETDITSVVRVLCTNNQEKGMSSFMVKSGMLEMWGISREEIYEQALKNTERIFKPDMRNMKEILLSGCMGTLSEEEQEGFRSFLNLDIPEQDQRAEKSKEILPYEQYVLTNIAKINGATAILYPNLLQEIGETTQSNFFILPSSIHEVILMKDNGDMNAEELQRMVMEINRTQVAPEEVLSDEVYSYDYRQQKLTMATSPIQTKELLDQITGMCDHDDFMEEEQEADLCMGE